MTLSRYVAVSDPPPPQDASARLAALSATMEVLSSQMLDCRAAVTVSLPDRLTAVESRVQATAQTCADAVKIIAHKHQAITALLAEVKGSQMALDGQLQSLGLHVGGLKQLRAQRAQARATDGGNPGGLSARLAREAAGNGIGSGAGGVVMGNGI